MPDKAIFSRKVVKTKKEMIAFLSNHFRYWTMNSWNLSTSYANNVKIWKVIPKELQDQAFEIMSQGDVYNKINSLIHAFNVEHDWQWQVGFNGRNNGYLVLYQGGCRHEKRFRCLTCGRTSFLYDGNCPYCHDDGITSKLVQFDVSKPFVYSGKSVDADKNFVNWDLCTLKERVKLVQEFDKLCNKIVDTFIYYCKTYKVEETEVMVPQKIKVLRR